MAVRVEKNDHVWTVVHSRPKARNAMNHDHAERLAEAFMEFECDEKASVAVFWGEGGAFCAGWDLKSAAGLNPDDPFSGLHFPAENRQDGSCADVPRGPMGPSRLELNKPVIAAVAGPAVAGGMELALWCDFRVMEQSAYMGVYCRRWGMPLIDGGTVRLPRLVGQGRAMEILLTGRKVPAEECARIGLCEYVVEDGHGRDKAEELAHEIAKFPQECVRADRRSALRQHGRPVSEALEYEWNNGQTALITEGMAGAGRFTQGLGRHGDFRKLK